MIKLDILYRQLAVFVADITNPYNNWSTKSFNQGFSYRNESVSFDTIEDGVFQVYINEENNQFDNDLIRRIIVPIKTNNGFEVGSTNYTVKLIMKPNEYVIDYSLYKNKIIHLQIRKGVAIPKILIMNDKEAIQYEGLFLNEEMA